MPSFGPGSLFPELASVTINFAAASVGRASFGTCMVIADDYPASTRTATYSSAQEVEAALAASEITSALSTKLKAMLAQTPSPDKVKLGKRDTSGTPETYAAAIQAIIAADSDWYALVVDSRTDVDIQAAIAEIQTQEASGNFYLCVGQSSSADWLTSGKPSGYLSEERGIVLYHSSDTEPGAECWAAKVLAFDADETSAPWVYQSLASVAAYATALTTAQGDFVDANFGNRLGNFGTSYPAVTFKGFNLAGRPVDHVLTADLIRFRSSERVADMVVSLAAKGIKLTVDTEGQGAIEGELQGLGEVLINAGHIDAGEWEIGPQTITAADRTAQRLRFINNATVENPLITAAMTFNLSTSPITGAA